MAATLCPKGANTFQLATNPHRDQACYVSRPYSDKWEQRPLDWAMDRIAQLTKEAREEGFVEERRRQTSQPRDQPHVAGRRHHGQRRELPDQEALRRRTGYGSDRKPGPNLTQRFGARSGRLVRPRRGHQLPGRHAERRLRSDHGLQYGGSAPGRFPLPDDGAGARRQVDPRRSALFADLGDVPALRADPDGNGYRVSRRPDQLHPGERSLVPRVRAGLHECHDHHQRRVPGHRRPGRVFCGFDPEENALRPGQQWPGITPAEDGGSKTQSATISKGGVVQRTRRSARESPSRDRPDPAASALRAEHSEAAL